MTSLFPRRTSALLITIYLLPTVVSAQSPPTHSPQSAELSSPASFDTAAPAALKAMRQQAEDRKIGGVALLAFFEGDKIESWTSKMLVVGHYKVETTEAKKGSNLLAVAYAKAAEMADTLKDSGSKVREPYTGEVGWQGGVIVPWRNGYLIAAFSGGKSEDDVAVSHAGVAAITGPQPETR